MVSSLRTLDFQQITSFLAVIRHGGVSAGAAQLGLAKSAVSKHVSQLESILRVKLLERSSRRVSLTREGEHLLSRLESLLAEGELLLEQASQAHDRPAGLVRIAATPDFGGLVAERFFPLVLARYPELGLAVEPSYELVDLQDPAFDLAFRIGDIKDDRLVARPLGTFHRIVVASPDRLRASPVRSVRDLPRHEAILFSGSRLHAEWHLTGDDTQTVCRMQGRLAAKSFRILLALAERGAGLAFVPDFIAADAIAAGRLKRCLADHASEPTPVFLTYRVGSDRIRRIRAVIDLALSEIPRLLAPAASRSRTRTQG